MTYHTPTTDRLTRLARRLGLDATVIRSDRDMSGRYLLYAGSLPLTPLGWSRQEAAETLRRLAAERE